MNGYAPVRRLRVAVVAHLRHPIGPPFAGGMEALTWRLTTALVRRGHDVTLFASGDSDTTLPLSAAIPKHYDRTWPWHRWHDTPELHAWLDNQWPEVMDRIESGGFDVIHNHSLHPEPLVRAVENGLPMITTLHIPPFHTLRKAVQHANRPWILYAAPSAAMTAAWWDAPPDTLRIVPNGVDLELWRPCENQRGAGSAVWFGRITPNKGVSQAIQAAIRADCDLDLYGRIEDRHYWNDAVRPLLDERRRHHGALSGQQLASAVSRHSVALFTPLWDEPFGLTAAEAMACDLPVAAFDAGAAREVVGPCGAFAAPGDVEGLADALLSAKRVTQGRPRERARRLFDEAEMVRRYETLYVEATDQCCIL